MKRVVEAISDAVASLPSAAKTLGRAGVLGGLLAATSAQASTTLGAPTDLDSTYGTSYTPDGGVGCLAGLVPHMMTGSLGFRSDVCEETFEQTSDGITFTDIKSNVADAITATGATIDETYLGPCDYSDNFDELLVLDPVGQKLFVIGGLSTGSVTRVNELQGNARSCGSIDEVYGAYHAPADTRGFSEIHEFTASRAPSPLYNYGTDDMANTSVDLNSDWAVFTNEDDSFSGNFVEGLSLGSGATVTSLGTGYGFTAGLYGAHETGGNPTIVYSDESAIKYTEISTTTLDPDSDSDGYPDSSDCDDADASVHPGAAEVCDGGVDNDCNSSTREDAVDGSTWYRDRDGDGVGSSESTTACDQPEGYVAITGDSDDTNPNVQGEPVCDGESSDGSYEAGEEICTDDGEVFVWDGTLEYSSQDKAVIGDDKGDWGEWVDENTVDLSSYADRWVLNTDKGSTGGFGIGISDDTMESIRNAAPTPPLSEGEEGRFVTFRLDGGNATLNDKFTGAIIQELSPGYNTVEVPEETDTDTDTDAKTDDTGRDGGNDDGNDDGGGCNTSGRTPLDSTEAVIGLAGLGLVLARRRRS